MAKVSLRGLRRRGVDFESLWLITFADLMVQLMAFFAVIYSFSIQGQEQMNQVLRSLQKELGVNIEGPALPGSTGILPGTTGIGTSRAADLEKLLADMQVKEGPTPGSTCASSRSEAPSSSRRAAPRWTRHSSR